MFPVGAEIQVVASPLRITPKRACAPKAQANALFILRVILKANGRHIAHILAINCGASQDGLVMRLPTYLHATVADHPYSGKN